MMLRRYRTHRVISVCSPLPQPFLLKLSCISLLSTISLLLDCQTEFHCPSPWQTSNMFFSFLVNGLSSFCYNLLYVAVVCSIPSQNFLRLFHFTSLIALLFIINDTLKIFLTFILSRVDSCSTEGDEYLNVISHAFKLNLLRSPTIISSSNSF